MPGRKAHEFCGAIIGILVPGYHLALFHDFPVVFQGIQGLALYIE